MKRWFGVVLIISFILIVSVSFVSANVLSDFWNKITGKAVSGVCGNNVREGSEFCDESALGKFTCVSFGFFGGELLCRDDCKGFDTSQCVEEPPIVIPPPIETICGNGIIEGDEECDNLTLTITSCSELNSGYTEGNLSCDVSCNYNKSQCVGVPIQSYCGDGIIDLNEQCDSENLAISSSCIEINSSAYSGGNLSCTASCEYNFSQCTGLESSELTNQQENNTEETEIPEVVEENPGIITTVVETVVDFVAGIFGGGEERLAIRVSANPGDASIEDLKTTANYYNNVLKETPTLEEATNRKRVMLQIAEENPEVFLENAMTPSLRETLPENIKMQIEEERSLQGNIIVINFDEFNKSKTSYKYFLNTPAQKFNLFFSNNPPFMVSRTEIELDSYKLEDTLVANTSKNNLKILSSPPKENVVFQKTLVMLTTYLDSPPPIVNLDEAKEIFFESGIKNFYNETSYGKFSFNGDVVGWITLQENSLDNPYPPLCNIPWDVDKIAKENNITLLNYDNVIVYLNRACNDLWGGFGTLGKVSSNFDGVDHNLSYAWISAPPEISSDLQDFSLFESITSHELGHNIGAGHANELDCSKGVVPNQECVSLEYSNAFDVMGAAAEEWDFKFAWHFNAYFKELFGWLDDEDIRAIKNPGEYNITLKPIETQSGIRVVKIPADRIDKEGNIIYGAYYIEYRRPIGYDSRINKDAPYTNLPESLRELIKRNMDGLSINWVQDSWETTDRGSIPGVPWTNLIDTSNAFEIPSPIPDDYDWFAYMCDLYVFALLSPSENNSGVFEDNSIPLKIGPIISANDNEIVFIIKKGISDTSPPRINITSLGDNRAFISCQDNESGCNESSYRYYLNSYSGGRRVACPLELSQYRQNDPRSRRYENGFAVILTSSSWVCAYAEDNAGNQVFSEPTWVDINSEPLCGNTIIEGTEQCDDGNIINGDGCSSICQVESTLSSEVIQSFTASPTEIVSGDSTTLSWSAIQGSTCVSIWSNSPSLPIRGSYIINSINKFPATFSLQCTYNNIAYSKSVVITEKIVEPLLPLCDNGIIEAGEQCDDGNAIDGDGCSAICQIEIVNQGVCIESDDGLDYYEKGNLIFNDEKIGVDSCTDDGQLNELYCAKENTAYTSALYDCPNGCNEGACIKGKLSTRIVNFFKDIF